MWNKGLLGLDKKELLAISIILVMHLIGFVGLQSPYKNDFASLTPYNLLLTFLLLIPFYSGKYTALLQFFILTFSLGMIVEIIGVQTNFPFGSYWYSSLLGYSLAGVPFLIGVNWFILSYGIVSCINSWMPNFHWLGKALIGAGAMTFMDLLIEPFAIHFNLWVWEVNTVPLSNYIAWFVISFSLLLVGFKIYPKVYNKVAGLVFLLFVLFFGLNYFAFLLL